MLDGLLSNEMSGDVWWLAAHHAQKTALAGGVSEADFAEVMSRFKAIRQARRQQNPMHSMF